MDKSNSLGVFMFGTRSDFSRAIPNDPRDPLDAGKESVNRLNTQHSS